MHACIHTQQLIHHLISQIHLENDNNNQFHTIECFWRTAHGESLKWMEMYYMAGACCLLCALLPEKIKSIVGACLIRLKIENYCQCRWRWFPTCQIHSISIVAVFAAVPMPVSFHPNWCIYLRIYPYSYSPKIFINKIRKCCICAMSRSNHRKKWFNGTAVQISTRASTSEGEREE